MLDLTNIYKKTKYLDSLFNIENDIKSLEIIEKNKLELLVEFGELANETRCFKYWSKRQTGDREKILEEYIDCLFMVLYFCNIAGVSMEEDFPKSNDDDLIKTFLNLYEYGSKLDIIPKKEEIKKILVELLYLSKLLGFTIEDLELATISKSKIIQKRMSSDY